MEERHARSLRLLRTKLYIPRAHPDRVERPWLVRRLSDSLRARLTLVTAPAGFGKTTLLATWVAQAGVPAAWVSLDERDNDPVRFWGYCIAALQTVRAEAGHAALAMLQSPEPPPAEVALTELLNDLADIPSDFVLVLDDYHLIDTPAIHAGLGFVLEHLPPEAHVILAGRADPPLPLPLWRGRRELIELSAADLRFSGDEATALFNRVMNLNLAAEDVAALVTLTEGWAAGLQLAALALQSPGAGPRADDVSAFVRSFSGSQRYVFDYLAQEVLSRQDETVQRFLLETAVLDRLSAPLCDAVTGRQDSQAVLERLESANLFVVRLDQQRQWYRYHHLFADFLQARLEQSAGPTAPAEQWRRAAGWYEAHDFVAEAIALSLRAGDFAHAAELTKRAADGVFLRGEWATITRWLEALPATQLQTDPVVNAIYAWVLLVTGRFDEVEPQLAAIERTLGSRAGGAAEGLSLPPGTRGALAEICVIRANVAFHHMDLAATLALSRRAAAYLTDDVRLGLFQEVGGLRGLIAFNRALAHEFEGNVPAAGEAYSECIAASQGENERHLLLFGLSHLGQLQAVQGQLRQAAETYGTGLRAVEGIKVPPSPVSGLTHACLGQLLIEWNDLERAEEHLVRGAELGRQWANWETLLSAQIGLAHLKAAQGRFDEAFAALDWLEEFARQAAAPWGVSLAGAYRAWLQARTGAAGAAAAWAERAASALADLPEIPYAQEREAIVVARTLLALQRPDDAAGLLARLLAPAEAGERHGRVVEMLVLQSVQHALRGEREAARRTLARALAPAEREGYTRLFLDAGAPLAGVLADLAAGSPFAGRLLQLLDAAGAHGPALLSARERAVLRLMAEGRTNQEIADALVVSLNTVKTHVKNIHSRLEASNRTQAVARARELGLLPPD